MQTTPLLEQSRITEGRANVDRWFEDPRKQMCDEIRNSWNAFYQISQDTVSDKTKMNQRLPDAPGNFFLCETDGSQRCLDFMTTITWQSQSLRLLISPQINFSPREGREIVLSSDCQTVPLYSI